MTTFDTSSPIERARELFFSQQRDPGEWLAPHISRSWRRSLPSAHGWIDQAPLSLAMLRERREQALRLRKCAQPELDGLAEHAIGNGCVVVLTDAHGLILEEIGSPEFLPKAERVALAPGVEWSEGSRGTNAIGTALAEREPLMVLGGEHYRPENGAIGCAAAPIFTGRGDIAGVLDISGETARVNHHALGLVRIAAQQVEHRMMRGQASGHLLRMHPVAALLGTAREGLVVIEDGHIVGINRCALMLLGGTWEALIGQPVDAVLGLDAMHLEHLRGSISLPSGKRLAAIVERCAPTLFRGGAPVVDEARDAAEARHDGDAQQLRKTASVRAASEDVVAPLLCKATRVLDAGVAVLVRGETGSGKEVFARRLHRASRNANGPFVAVNCAALPEHLIEAELFGYEEGAFTGARRRGSPGRIREAHGGVLFLDEIADMPVALQTRLLRVLEEREVSPLGGGAAVKVDFDLISATHENLAELASAGRFRSDLLYRVMGYSVAVPALRERADRRALIATLFDECGGKARGLRLEAAAIEALAAYRWPGNVRELRSTLAAMNALCERGTVIAVGDLPAHLFERVCEASVVESSEPAMPAEVQPTSTPALDAGAIERAIEASGHNVSEAARRLGVHRSTLYRQRAAKR